MGDEGRTVIASALYFTITEEQTSRASQVALVVKNLPANAGDLRDTGSIPAFDKIPWRRAWQSTPVFLPGESLGQRSLAGFSPLGGKGSDRTEAI